MANSMNEDGAYFRVDEFAATKLRDVIELLILYRDLILFSLSIELIIISSDGLSPYQIISCCLSSYGLAKISLKFMTLLF